MRMVDGARGALRWYSVQAMAVALAVQAAWTALPPDLAARVPDWVASAVTGAVLVLGILGRLVDQGGGR
jgi:hypothetical protein